ncbi:MAG: ornithine carbamoyltransferase [Myxococcota bacterium]|mgnify:CR=1 FL=1|jgi:ornithine carbamoyltransferase|nr:ornithine carbamoyltransferase [Deltaproteobacteria bacterium]MCP4244144.1 ornithine carbamoyltransferase [bacterium]MDP6076254.1 ornithine carbamoyltransferase [Myxococcota bacterium]MDP6243717.1 ornithine carbamoyltransferase [Myxococcota bacterium]MDP7074960.1 ornithine carbamoyltransferase [Myxococcota bacterium]
MPKNFVSLAEWPADELWGLLDRARRLKELDRTGQRPQTLQGRVLAMFFEKPSLRTHVTFEAGMTQLGGHAILLRPEQVGIGTRESPGDVARNLSRWLDGLVARTFSHDLVEEFASAATIPVINGLTDLLHPCQVMADFQTIAERRPLKDAVIAYVGDGNNVANSLLLGSAVLGLELRLATPPSHRPSARVRQQADDLARASGARLSWFEESERAVDGADFVYTDVWTSMGQEDERERRREIFAPYQVNAALLRSAPDAFVLHCLPAHRGEEITDDVLDGERSIVFDQAENRLHAQKAILERLLAPPS